MRYITVVVTDASGCPAPQVRVSLFLHQTGASGMTRPEYTDGQGRARFTVDMDTFGQVSVYVAGNERVGRGSPQAEYWVRT